MASDPDFIFFDAFILWLSAPDEIALSRLAAAYLNASSAARDRASAACEALAREGVGRSNIIAEWRAKQIELAAPLRRKVSADLRDALKAEHIQACNHHVTNTCDINTAYKHKLYAWAAHLLMGATECEAVTNAFREYAHTFPDDGTFQRHLSEQCAELLAVPHIKCTNCDDVVWEPDDCCGDRCGNCNVKIPAARTGYELTTGEVVCGNCLAADEVKKRLEDSRTENTVFYECGRCDVTFRTPLEGSAATVASGEEVPT